MRILIVDDEAAIAELLRATCARDGHEVTVYTASLDARRKLEAHTFDLLITDIAMSPPDGLQLVREAVIWHPKLMAIAITGYAGHYTLPEVLTAGGSELMFKPLRMDEVRARVALASERHRVMVRSEDPENNAGGSPMDRPIALLLVEDVPDDARLLRDMLSDRSLGLFHVTTVGRLSEAVTHLETNGADIVLMDLGLPDAQGLEGVRKAHAVAPLVPVVVLTGSSDRALAALALQEGVQDYLLKGELNGHALNRVLRYAIARQRTLADTERHRKQQLRIKDELMAHELRLKDEFLSHVSHELRSPLAAIHGFSTILLDGLAGKLNSTQLDYLQIVVRNIGQLQTMIDDLLEVTRLQTGKLSVDLQRVSVAEAIDDAIDTLLWAAAAKGVVLSSHLDEANPFAYADPARTRQILINLIGNAIKFTPAGGAVTVMVPSDQMHPDFVVCKVSDTGCGLDKELANRIFERLYQGNDPAEAGRKGLGLGLYICKELVVRQGGRIWVDSTPEHGSVFYFTLPAFVPESASGPKTHRDARAELGAAAAPRPEPPAAAS